jgi:Protein of unknown function (DUF1552)
MNLVLGKQLPRRAFLRGAGSVIALPLLDAMIPAFGRAASTAKATNRMAFVYVPNGIVMDSWLPKTEGQIAKLPAALPSIVEPLAPYREDIMMLSGLTQNGGRALGDGPGDHGRAGANYLTSVHPKKTFGKDIKVGISVDQVAAQKLAGETRFGSIELGCEQGIQGGNCDNGYSCAYSNSISWRTPSTPNPPEVRPRAVFERLFGSADFEPDPVKRARAQRYDRSVLDLALNQTNRLKGTLGATDRRKLDEYLSAVRDIEKRIQSVEGGKAESAPQIGNLPTSIPAHFQEHSRLMFDIMALAFQTDSTRVATIMLALEQSNRPYRELNISEAHHGLTHHRGDPEKIAKIAQINRYHVEQFAYFLGKLRSIKDGDGTLLDHVMVTYGSGLADGNRHEHHNLPTILAGRGCGGLHPAGRHLKYPDETPMANLHVAMLDKMGVPAESLGDSNGKLGYLADL